MKVSGLSKIWNKLPFFLLLACFGLASIKAYVTIQTTLLGYKIGQIKQNETDLLESQSLLKMELAKLTRRESLMNLTPNTSEANKEAWVAH